MVAVVRATWKREGMNGFTGDVGERENQGTIFFSIFIFFAVH